MRLRHTARMRQESQPDTRSLPKSPERLSSVDRAFLNMERATNPMVIVALIVLGAPLKRAQVRDRLAARLLAHRRFCCVPREGLAQAQWEPFEGFDIDDHVLATALPAPGHQQALEQRVGELASEPLPQGRPLWSFHVVERYGRGSAIIARIHHCYADGIALVRILLSLSEGPAPPERRGHRQTAGAPARRTMALMGGISQALQDPRRLAEAGLHWALHPQDGAAAAREAAGLLEELARLAVLPDDPPSRLKRPLSGIRRVAWGAPLLLEEVRTIGKVLGCTVNDVLISTLAGALGQHLAAQGDDTHGVTLRATVPVDLRSSQDAPPELGNQFGLVFVELPIGVRHPLERLYQVRSGMRALKGSEQAMLTYGLLATVGSLPRPLEDLAMGIFSAKASLVASNLRGPEAALQIAGVSVRQLLFWVPQSGSIGTGISILSYHGHVQFGVIADRALIPEPTDLIARIQKAFEQLVLLVLLGGAALS